MAPITFKVTTLAALFAFAFTHGMVLVLSHLASVYLFDYWEPSFGDQRDNVVAFLWALPFFVGMASLSFAVGLRVSATFKRFRNRTAAAKVGVFSSILASLAVGLAFAVEAGGGLEADGTVLATFIGAPCLAAVVGAILVERRSGGFAADCQPLALD